MLKEVASDFMMKPRLVFVSQVQEARRKIKKVGKQNKVELDIPPNPMTEKEHYTIFSKEVLIGGNHNKIDFTTLDLQNLIEDAVYNALKRVEADKTFVVNNKKKKE